MTDRPNTPPAPSVPPAHGPVPPVARPLPPTAPPVAPAVPPPARPSRPAPLMIGIGVAIGLFFGIGGTLVAGSLDFSGSPFHAALDACGLENGPTSRIGDNGATLDLDHQGEDDRRGIGLVALNCVLEELEVPDSVMSQMDRTRALDGRQTAEWDGIEASWSYHPDTGLDVLLTVK